jgi:hypothetical protein
MARGRGHISKITGKEYTFSDRGKALFNRELEDYGLSTEEYIEKYFENVANISHKRTLNEGEHYLICKTNFVAHTYQKVIVHDKLKCDICDNFFAIDISGFMAHSRRTHKFDNFKDYLLHVGYIEQQCDYKKCGFCGREADHHIEYDHIKRTFIKIYPRYKCSDPECIDQICIRFFGVPYSESMKKYEHIGADTEYLKIIYQTDENGLELIGKSKKPKVHGRWCCNLNGFIEKYGIVEGFEKYHERCKKVGFGATLEGYISRHGEEKGKEKYLERINKTIQRNRYFRISKGQRKLFNMLVASNIGDFVLEYPTIKGTPDIYDLKNNVVIEFYGDFWHCNPLIYPKGFYNKAIKMGIDEKHKFDKNRIGNIKEELNSKKAIIIWEKSFNEIPNDILLEQIKVFILGKLEGDLWI